MFLHIIYLGHSLLAQMPHQSGSSAQRIRIGLTGLGIAFVIVLFASAINRSSRDDTANNITQATSNEPSEPLAELGVAPGASDASNTSNNSAAPKK